MCLVTPMQLRKYLQIIGIIMILLIIVLSLIPERQFHNYFGFQGVYLGIPLLVGGALMIVISVYRARTLALLGCVLVCTGIAGASAPNWWPNWPWDDSSFWGGWLPVYCANLIPLGILCCLGAALLSLILGPFPKPGQCVKCGYNLTGNISGVCPECGEKI